jgi:hypothetical protein
MEATTQMPGKRSLLVAAAVIVTLAVIALVIAARSPDYPAGSPEAAAQEYLRAALDGKQRAALELVAPELKEVCDRHDLVPWWIRSSDVAEFEAVEVTGDRAFIDVRLSDRDYAPPPLVLDSPQEPRRGELMLERQDGTWLITELHGPWSSCPQN